MVSNLSGSISSTKLFFSISKVTNSTKKPDYNIKVTYKWSKPYYWEIFSDKIAVAWGGNLNVKRISSNAEYYDIKGFAPFFKYKKYYNSKSWSYTE